LQQKINFSEQTIADTENRIGALAISQASFTAAVAIPYVGVFCGIASALLGALIKTEEQELKQ
jgi:hypothetical protein